MLPAMPGLASGSVTRQQPWLDQFPGACFGPAIYQIVVSIGIQNN